MGKTFVKTNRLLLTVLILLALLAACDGAAPGQDPLAPADPDPDGAGPGAESSSGLCGAPLAPLLLLGFAAVVAGRPSLDKKNDRSRSSRP